MNVIYHIDEMSKWPLTLANVKNMLTYYRENDTPHTIEVLANSEAVNGYLPSSKALSSMISELAQTGVLFTACRNALAANNISPETLPSHIHPVPAGVVELAQKQSEGYAYIKP